MSSRTDFLPESSARRMVASVSDRLLAANVFLAHTHNDVAWLKATAVGGAFRFDASDDRAAFGAELGTCAVVKRSKFETESSVRNGAVTCCRNSFATTRPDGCMQNVITSVAPDMKWHGGSR